MCLSSNVLISFGLYEAIARLSSFTRAAARPPAVKMKSVESPQGDPLPRSDWSGLKHCAHASKKAETACIRRRDRSRGSVRDYKMVSPRPSQLMRHSALNKRRLRAPTPPIHGESRSTPIAVRG